MGSLGAGAGGAAGFFARQGSLNFTRPRQLQASASGFAL